MTLENVSVWVAVVPAPTPMAIPELLVVLRLNPLRKGAALQSQLKTAPAFMTAEVVRFTVLPVNHVPLPLTTGFAAGGFHCTEVRSV